MSLRRVSNRLGSLIRFRLLALFFAFAVAVLLGPAAEAWGGSPLPAQAADSAAPVPGKLRVLGVRVNVAAIDPAVQFYTRACGFELAGKADAGSATLQNGPVRLLLRRASKPPQAHYPGDAQSHVNFVVTNLESSLREISKQGFKTVEKTPQPTAIGTYITLKDPSGNIHQLIQLKPQAGPPGKPEVFNLEIEITDMKKAREFYNGKLELPTSTEDYYPPTIPLKQVGVAPLVLQETATKTVPVNYPNVAQTIIQFGTSDLTAAIADLKAKGVEFLGAPQASADGRYTAFKDPFGNVFELVEVPVR
jgi:lactoylglutathione lyase